MTQAETRTSPSPVSKSGLIRAKSSLSAYNGPVLHGSMGKTPHSRRS